MSARFVRILLFACMTGAMALGASAAAGDDKLSHDVGVALQAADKAMKANDLATATAKIQEAMAVADRTDFDTYTIEQFAANLALKQNDLKGAEGHFKAVASSPALKDADKKNVYTVLVQVATNLQDWPTVVQYGSLLQSANALESNLVEPLAVAYFDTGAQDKAIALAKQQIDADRAAGRQPSQALLEIMTNAEAGSKNNAAAIQNLETLVQNYGDPNDWARLIDNEGFTLRGLTDLQALDIYRLRVAVNATTPEEDYAIMATVTSKAGYPGETVAMLEHGMSSGAVKPGSKAASLLPGARAKEAEDKRSLPSFDAQARAHKTGEFDVKLAETYYGYGRYAEAEEAARRALSKGGLKSPAEAKLLVGMSLARQGKNQDAEAAFAQVDGGANDKTIAHLWTVYVTRKYGAAPAAPQH